jgi:peptide/nickel transport system substrate-binding protein
MPIPLDQLKILVTCSNYRPRASDYINEAGLCDHAIDREIARAASLQVSDPPAAAALWTTIDRRIVDAAPLVAYGNEQAVHFVSRRVGNYQYNPQYGALLDQMWVR